MPEYLWSWIFVTACKVEDKCIFAEIDCVSHLENECVQWLIHATIKRVDVAQCHSLQIVTTIIETICCKSTA